MSDYHQIEREQDEALPEPPAVPQRRGGIATPRAAGVLGLLLATAATVALVATLHVPAGGERGSLLPSRPELKRGKAGYFCSCPPSFAIWSCTKDAYDALMNGTTCAYYRSAPRKCEAACKRDEAGMECRACQLGVGPAEFCAKCVSEGLNDVGCRGCSEPVAAAQLVGADADEHGCRPSAGYAWCASKASCVRPFEQGFHSRDDFEAACSKAQPAAAAALLGGDADAHGCRASAGYSWCEAKAACVRPWELGLRSSGAFEAECAKAQQTASEAIERLGGDTDAHGCRPSAGYSWCAARAACVRPWELGLGSKEAFEAECSRTSLKAQQPASEVAERPGGDADAHGCRPSAGYSWCAARAACVRPWELGLHSKEALEAECSKVSLKARLGGDRDPHGCIPSAGYSWCEATSSCVRPWELGLKTPEDFRSKCQQTKAATTEVASVQAVDAPIVGGDRDAHGCIPSAGYSWCAAMAKCIRPWEHQLSDEATFKAKCSPRGSEAPLYP